MASQATFVVGRDVGVYGRWFRLITGIYFALLGTAAPLIREPVSTAETLSFLGEMVLYFLVILAVYLVAFYFVAEPVLSKANPWVGTLIFLGPWALIVAFNLGPAVFQVALGVYISVSLIFNFVMSYGGCEVIAIPSLIFRRRYTVYCPYNAVDSVESALLAGPPGQQIFGVASIAVTFLVSGYYILLDLMDLGEFLGVDSDPRLALLSLIPVVYLVRNAWLAYERYEGNLSPEVTSQAIGAAVLALLAVIWFFHLSWFPF